jgi:hypothetical protein
MTSTSPLYLYVTVVSDCVFIGGRRFEPSEEVVQGFGSDGQGIGVSTLVACREAPQEDLLGRWQVDEQWASSHGPDGLLPLVAIGTTPEAVVEARTMDRPARSSSISCARTVSTAGASRSKYSCSG